VAATFSSSSTGGLPVRSSSPLLVLALISACDADSRSWSSTSGLDSAAITAACDHFDYGEEEAISAGAGLEQAEHAHPHERLVVTLPEGTNGHTGYLHVHAEGGTETYLLLSENVPVSATDPDGAAVEPLDTGDATAGCSKAKLVLHYALPEAGLFLQVGPTETHTFTLISHVIGATEEETDAHVHEAADAGPETDAHVHTH
jgi:hypothetical protein